MVSLIPAEGGTGLKAEICTPGNLPSRRDSGNLISDMRIPECKSLGIPRLCSGSQANRENERFLKPSIGGAESAFLWWRIAASL